MHIGLVEIFEGEGNTLLNVGTIAFVNVVAIAANKEEYILKVKGSHKLLWCNFKKYRRRRVIRRAYKAC